MVFKSRTFSFGARLNIATVRTTVLISAISISLVGLEAWAAPQTGAPPSVPRSTAASTSKFDRVQVAVSAEGLGADVYSAILEIYLGHEDHALSWIGRLFKEAGKNNVSNADLKGISDLIADSFANARNHSTRQGLVTGVVFQDINEVPDEAYQELEKFYRELSAKLSRGEKPSNFVPGPNILAGLTAIIKQAAKPKSSDDMLVGTRLKGVSAMVAAPTLMKRAQVSGDSCDFGATMSNIESGLGLYRAGRVSPILLASAYLSASKAIESIGDVPPRNDLRWRRMSQFYAQRAWDLAESQPVSPNKVAILEQLISSRAQFWQLSSAPEYERLRSELPIMKQSLAKGKKSFANVTPNTVLSKSAEFKPFTPTPTEKLNVCFATIKDAAPNLASSAEILRLISKADEECTQHKWSQFKNSVATVMSSIDTAPLKDVERRVCNLAMGEVLYEQVELEQSNIMQSELHSNLQCATLAQECFERALKNCTDDKLKFQIVGKLASLTGSDEYYKQLLELSNQKGHSEKERYQLLMDYARAQSSKGDSHHAKQTYAQAFALSKKIGVTMTGVDTVDIRTVFERDNDYLGAIPFYEEEMRECRQRLGNDFKFSKTFVNNYCNCLIKAGKTAEATNARASLKVDSR